MYIIRSESIGTYVGENTIPYQVDISEFRIAYVQQEDTY